MMQELNAIKYVHCFQRELLFRWHDEDTVLPSNCHSYQIREQAYLLPHSQLISRSFVFSHVPALFNLGYCLFRLHSVFSEEDSSCASHSVDWTAWACSLWIFPLLTWYLVGWVTLGLAMIYWQRQSFCIWRRLGDSKRWVNWVLLCLTLGAVVKRQSVRLSWAPRRANWADHLLTDDS